MQVTDDNYHDLTFEDVEGAVASVKFGYDEEAARNLIHYFHFMLRDGGLFCSTHLNPKERLFIEFVEHAFARMTEERKSAEVAFGLKPGRGEYERKGAEERTERNVEICAYMILLTRNNMKWLDAKSETANRFFPDGKGDKAVESAYAEYKNELRLMKDDALKDLLPATLRP